MKKNFNKLIPTSLVTLSLLVFAGCSDNQTSSTQDSVKTKKDTTVTLELNTPKEQGSSTTLANTKLTAENTETKEATHKEKPPKPDFSQMTEEEIEAAKAKHGKHRRSRAS